MAKKVQIQKTVFDRTNFNETIDRKFKFYKELEPLIDPDNIGELFRLYDKLYLEIPIEGQTESHQYLVTKSSELYQIDQQLENIQPLLDEVAQLREQILTANTRIIELEIEAANGSELNFEDAEKVTQLQMDLAAANTSIVALEQANTIANSAATAANEAATAASDAATAAAETAAKNAAEQAAAAAREGSADEIKEIEGIINNYSRDKTGLAHRFIQKRYASSFFRTAWGYGYQSRTRWATRYSAKFYWLYGKDEDDKEYPSRRGGNYGGNFFIPATQGEADDMTLDFFVTELTQAGYKAGSIVKAVQNKGNMRGRVSFRVITFKDPDKEDKVGYRLK